MFGLLAFCVLFFSCNVDGFLLPKSDPILPWSSSTERIVSTQLCESPLDESPLDESPLGSLDAMLNKARKRKGVNFQYKIQAFLEAPVIQLEQPYPGLKSNLVYTRSDLGLILVALKIHAPGFALGLFMGKLTAGPLREITKPSVSFQIILLPLWPVVWAIGIDQVF